MKLYPRDVLLVALPLASLIAGTVAFADQPVEAVTDLRTPTGCRTISDPLTTAVICTGGTGRYGAHQNCMHEGGKHDDQYGPVVRPGEKSRTFRCIDGLIISRGIIFYG